MIRRESALQKSYGLEGSPLLIQLMIVCAVVLLTCIASNKLLHRFGVPSLLIFLVLGMLFGSDGIGRIYFNDFHLSENVASVGLAFILFFGGFSTNWQTAKPAVVRAGVLASLGTVLTAVFVGLFCHFVLGIGLFEALLIGAVLSSTDAASVFSILRSRKLGLKGELAPILEVESGTNDPFSYLLTIIMISLMTGGDGMFAGLIVTQFVFGIGIGVGLAFATVFALRIVKFENQGLYPIFIVAVVILAYALCGYVGGNGFLCVYLMGIIVGNSRIPHKKSLVHFFDAVSWLAQIMLFFVLGLLSTPSQMASIITPGLLVSVFIILIARPLAVFGILSCFRVPFREQLFISWVGLRGAASIAFAIIAVTHINNLTVDLFHMVFFVAILSVLIQGSLLPKMAKVLKLDMPEEIVAKTFTDYEEDTHTKLMEYKVKPGSKVCGKTIMDAGIPEEILVVLIKRQGEVVVPKGQTVVLEGDILVLSGDNFDNADYLE